jgi:1,5-anhydro-D-fructose reductase (1,5-anhydro-D-mannitol-forming)
MVRIAMLSFWHVHAKDYRKQALEHPQTELVAVWDEVPERGREEASRLGVPFYDSLDELLAQDFVDAVVVDTPTNLHPEVMIRAAEAKKHIFTEKVLALTLHDANRIVASVRSAGVQLMVSLPRLNDAYTSTFQEVVDRGLLGTISQVRVRLAHGGASDDWLPAHFYSQEQCGGGALTDLGCHPLYLTRLLLGLPDRVSAHYGRMLEKAVEDNAVSIFQYANGAIGIAETGFVTGSSPFTMEVHGTSGSAIYSQTESSGSSVRVKSAAHGFAEWMPYPMQKAKSSAFHQWVENIETGRDAEEQTEMALDLTKLVEASNLSAVAGQSVRLADLRP